MLAREALQLFIRSLPQNSMFTIISFGSRFETLKYNGQKSIEYNDESKDFAIDQVGRFDADFGGTEIVYPLLHV